PLRERQEDIPELAYHFLADASKRHGKSIEGIAEETMEALLGHPWPGNVRELSNVIERGVVFSSGPYLTPAELPAHLLAGPRARPQSGTMIEVPFGTSLKDVEELLIRKTLEATSGDKNMTAKLLGINSRTIYRKLDTKKTDQPAE
ncbi:MAG: AAA-type ATPase lid domain-containing protein, partial [Bdellovibrionota bacterium]